MCFDPAPRVGLEPFQPYARITGVEEFNWESGDIPYNWQLLAIRIYSRSSPLIRAMGRYSQARVKRRRLSTGRALSTFFCQLALPIARGTLGLACGQRQHNVLVICQPSRVNDSYKLSHWIARDERTKSLAIARHQSGSGWSGGSM